MVEDRTDNDETVAAAAIQEESMAKSGCPKNEERRGKRRKKRGTIFSRHVRGIKKVKERTSTIELLCEQNMQQSTVNVSSPRRRVNKRKATKEELRTTKESNRYFHKKILTIRDEMVVKKDVAVEEATAK